MGVDPARVPAAEAMAAALEQVIAIPDDQARTAYMIWLVDGRAIGYSGLKNIRHGHGGEIHLHMWEAAARGQGHGGRLFALSALAFYERFRLREIICEPKADNVMPNRMLAKAGFPLVGSRIGASSELSTESLLNIYAIPREIARRVADGGGQ